MSYSIHLYRFHFEKSEQELIKFMQLFKVDARIQLCCLIHETDCDEGCEYSDSPTLLINGFHWHILPEYTCEKYSTDYRILDLNLPYQYSFDGVDGGDMYNILKDNDNEHDYSGHYNAVEIEWDAEVISFTVIYYDEQVPFDEFLKKKDPDLAECGYDEDEIITEEDIYWCLDHELNEKRVKLESDENEQPTLKVET